MRRSRISQLIAWYVALLLPTLYVKYRFVLVLARWLVDGSSTPTLTDGEIASSAVLWWEHVVPADVLEVAAGVAIIGLVGHVLLRIPLIWLATVSVAVALGCLGVTLVALRETGTLVTWEALRTATNWVAQDTRIVDITARQGLLVAAAAFWIATPVVLTRALDRIADATPRAKHVVPIAAVALLAASAMARPDVFAAPDAITLTRGLWSSAMLALLRPDDRPPQTAVPAHDLLAEYGRLVYPAGRPATDAPLVELTAAERRPRHVLFVILETAPRELYRFIDNESLPTLREMARHALVSEQHRTSAPRTDLAVYSLLSGTYSRGASPIYQFGRFRSDGLATILAEHGFRATYIDSLTLKWNLPEEAFAISDLGFQRRIEVFDESDPSRAAAADSFETALARERRSLAHALDAMLDAERNGQKALVAIATNLGHFPLRTPAGGEAEPSEARVAAIAKAFDGLMAETLEGLKAERLEDEVIVVLVGDHGLRFADEFEAFGLPMRYGDLMFNVPLMVYAPALFPHSITVPWVTSHVDIEPTLLDLLGVSRGGLLLHGENMLDSRLADRVTFLPSGMFAPMYPVDGLSYRGTFYTWAYALDRVRSSPSSMASAQSDGALSPDQVRSMLRDSRRLFDETAAHFLQAATTQP